MVGSEESIMTSHPARKKGITIPRELYNSLSQFVLRNIYEGEFVTSLDLLLDAEVKFEGVNNLNWYIMHVKLDLEAKGMIQMTTHSSFRTKFLKLTSRGLKQLSQGILERD